MVFLACAVALALVVLVTMAPAGSRAPSLTAAAQYRRGRSGEADRAPAGSSSRPSTGGGVAVERLGPIPTIAAWIVLSSLGWYVVFLAVTAR